MSTPAEMKPNQPQQAASQQTGHPGPHLRPEVARSLQQPPAAEAPSDADLGLEGRTVRKRDGKVVPFDGSRIRRAIEKAFRAEHRLDPEEPLPGQLASRIDALAIEVFHWCSQQPTLAVEDIQDQVERTLMTAGEHRVARRYVLYREQRAQQRRERMLHVVGEDGVRRPLDTQALRRRIEEACQGLHPDVSPQAIYEQTILSLYDGVNETEVIPAAILAARSLIEREPDYTYAAARLLLGEIYQQGLGRYVPLAEAQAAYRQGFAPYIRRGVEIGRLDPELLRFDLDLLAEALDASRDLKFAYLGLQTLYDRYLIQDEGTRIELPQMFWMRVAMGLALREEDPTGRAVEFYDLISQMLYTPATPTLFNSGTTHPQLSSCYLSTVPDDLGSIFKVIRDNALLSKWAGGLGNDWTPVRAMGAAIKGTGGKSQGVIPFLKVANDTAVAVNQGGKRKGAVCAYLETWHLDIEEFLELRRNTGDERRRTHDMNTANWVPDLFMKRVLADAPWTLFSPDEVPDLHECYGREFERRYIHYEQLADQGKIRLFRRLPAKELWRKMLSMLFETGHPWITWKDPSNIRSPQDHAGVVHNSNLCTEILLNNSPEETAVCNLGSINLPAHIRNGQLDLELLEKTVRTAVRMLDNVIDINYYPTEEARRSNLRHRPIGLGIMGFQDALYELGLSYESEEAVEFADRSTEAISYFAILASAELARQRGKYPSYRGSKWDRGLLPIDTIDLLEEERGEPIQVDRSQHLDWSLVREAVAQYGMRNCDVMAIAPTATISNIVGVSQSIEPTFRNLYAKSNLSGEFTQVNRYLVRDLQRLGLWGDELLEALKYFDGVLEPIPGIPEEIKRKYRTAFEIDPKWLIHCAARRQKWIDMGQSLNLYLDQPSGRKLHEMYVLAWRVGLKTTYYLRTLGATHQEKSTVDINRFGIQPRWMKNTSPSAMIQVQRGNTCNLEDGECEACQ